MIRTFLFTVIMYAGMLTASAQLRVEAPQKSENKATATVPKANEPQPKKGRVLTQDERAKLRDRAIFLKAKQELKAKEGLANPSKKEVENEKKNQRKEGKK